MMKVTMLVAATAALGIGAPAAAHAQQRKPEITITQEHPSLMARAKVSGDSAIALARRAVPQGRFTKAELEEEDGVLIYSIDLEVPGKPGVYEVHVDALTGKVAPVEHEAAEAKDSGADRR